MPSGALRRNVAAVRVLVVASPLVGHVLPLVPLALALRDAGHEVRLATAAEGVTAGQRAGVPVHDVAPGLDVRRVFARPLLRHPLPVLRMVRGDEGTDGVGLLFAAVTERTVDGLVRLADGWRPDLVLHEGLAPAGAVAAARLGVPAVLVDALIYDGRRLLEAVVGHLDRVVRRYGVAALPAPAATITAVPAGLVGERRGHPMRPVASGGSGDVPQDLLDPGTRPVLLVSRSTADDPRRDRLMTTVVEAAAGADVDVVLVRPDRWVTRRPLPPNVRTADWLPFAAVLPHVAGIVHHGGSGTVLAALAAGVPQLVVPGAGDRTLHARLVAARGAGLAVPLAGLTTDALHRLAGDASLRTAAREVAAEIAAMPHPRDVVPALVALAERRATADADPPVRPLEWPDGP
ncbi:glycosyltransferase [Blastococcus sp. SYSU D00820]